MKRRIFAAVAATILMMFQPLVAQVQQTTFHLVAQSKFINCFGDGSGSLPTAEVTVTRGELNDTLVLHARHLKPNLGFDLFTIQNSNLLANGQPNLNFKNFGLAWYQSDLQANSSGNADVTIKTILLDQIFGFDPAVNLAPTNTFHVGFWFNNPRDAKSCGFNPDNPTPFNGEHKAGPNAMISVPNATTNLGPLCTHPENTGGVFTCHP